MQEDKSKAVKLKRLNPESSASEGENKEEYSTSISSSSDSESSNNEESDKYSIVSDRSCNGGESDNEGGENLPDEHEEDACSDDDLAWHVKNNCAIVIPICSNHHRHAERSCRFHTSPADSCDKLIYDLCHISREVYLNKYPQLKFPSKLLCDNHFN